MRNDRKENKTVKFAIIVLALTMIVLILVAGTYAKYTSSGTGNDTATVAKWSFKVGDKDITTASDAFTFDLFKTIKDTAGADESDVKSGKIIAPGTSGSFDIAIKNESEVNAKYTAAFELTNAGNIPVEFSTDGGESWKSTISGINITDKAIAMGASDTVKVEWRWAYEGSGSTNFKTSQTDTTDTKLGTDAQTSAATLTVTANVTATQVD